MSALRQDLRAITADGAAANIMVGVGENYLPAFVLALTGSQVACGLTPTLPLLAGGVLQLVAPRAIAWLGSYRRWVVLCAIVQAVVFLPLAASAMVGHAPLILVFAAISLYWGTGLAGGPAWNTWVATLIPERFRARYLACRTRIAQGGLLFGFLLGGIALQVGRRCGATITPFVLLFLVAAASRTVSAWFLARQSEPSPPSEPTETNASRGGLARAGSGAPGRVLLFMLLVQSAVQVSGPYFTPYMLCQLGLSYTGYVTLLSAAYLAKIVFLPLAGRLAARWGAHRLLVIGGAAIAPSSALWLVSDAFGYLTAIQIYSGIAWAIYELAMLLVFVQAVPPQQRVRILTVYNLANATAILLGSLAGGAVLSALGEVREGYRLLFALSASARVAALLMFLRVPQTAVFHRPIQAMASLRRPVLAFGRALLAAAFFPFV